MILLKSWKKKNPKKQKKLQTLKKLPIKYLFKLLFLLYIMGDHGSTQYI